MVIIKTFVLVSLFLGLMISCGDNGQPGKIAPKEKVAQSEDTVKRIIKTIIFFGNSITAGYGLELSEAFPALIQRKIDSLNLPYKVINAGVSGETSSGGNTRVNWVLRQPADVFVLELGGNDGLRGVPLTETKKNLQSIIEKVKARNPGVKIILAGMQIPPNMGKIYTTEFQNIYPDLAKKNNIALIPFLLEGVGGEAKLNLDDGIHPTPEGHRILAENVWKILRGLL